MKRRRNNTSGLSRGVDFFTTREDDELQYEHRRAGTYEDRWNEAKAQLCRMFDLLSLERPHLFNASGHNGFSDIPIYNSNAPNDDDWNDDYFQPGIGEEGLINSNAGGEYQYHTLLSSLLKEAPARLDMRDRHYRTEDTTQAWQRQLPRLVDAFMKFHASSVPEDDELEEEEGRINMVDFDTYTDNAAFCPVRDAHTANETFLRYGLLGGSPDQPKIAFPVHFLETYRQIHRVCPRFTLNGLSRVVTNIHGHFPMPSLEDQLRVAYDAYLSIQKGVQAKVDQELGCNRHKRFVHNVCPPCMYEVEGETPLNPSILLAMDGNNLLKMVDTEKRSGRSRVDTRPMDHPRWLDFTTVDVFKDEVVNLHRRSENVKSVGSILDADLLETACDGPELPNNSDNLDEGIAWLNVNEMDELEACVDVCVERWKAARPDANKKMYSFFSISGIFLSVCRHGHVLVMCDMRRSGELMKYLLAIVKALLDRYGKDIGLGLAGNFIYQTYRQVLERIAADGPLFSELCEEYGVTEEDCVRFLLEEKDHLLKEREELPEVAARLDYVELLQKVTKLKNSSDEAQAKAKEASRSQRVPRKQLAGLQTRSRTALDRYKAALEESLDFENEHDHYRRWEPTDSKYQETMVAMRGRNYRQALDKLEQLVVQRVLELTKLNMSGVGT
ncbi:hypothetical protein PQX77_021161 [Marasmius sp. AFHP31]|nr:hypothetical protein PQX77_021161 [Marasmius sp. AFHP31]